MDLQNLNKDKTKRNALDLGTMVYGKVPPQSKDLEEAILGAIMLERGAIDKVAELLTPDSFYVHAHQTIFKSMLELLKKSQPIDILTVAEQLRTMGELEAVGGPYYVQKLTNHVVSSAHIERHSHIIKDKYTKRELIRIGGELIQSGYEDTTDVNDIMDDHDKNITTITSDRVKNHWVPIDVAVVKMIQRLEDLRHKKEDLTGVTSGFVELDHITYGWQDTDLIILAARPAVGKTALALNLASNAALRPDKPTPVAFFSMEMSTDQLVQRLVSAESEIWLEKIARGKMEEDEMKKLYATGVQRISQSPLYIDDTPALNIMELRAKLRRLKAKYNIGLAIIDYLQLMSGMNEKKNNNREQEISTISRNLKALAKELKIPIIALSQLSRATETRKGDNKMPQLSDLRESGAIEQDADLVMFMYRPEYYDQKSDAMGENTQGLTLIDIAKHRNGKIARGDQAIKLKALLHIQKFVVWDSLITAYKASPGWSPAERDDRKDDKELPF